MEMLIAVGFFGLISAIVYFVLAPKAPVADDAIQQRLENIGLQPLNHAVPFDCTRTMKSRCGNASPISFLVTKSCRIASTTLAGSYIRQVIVVTARCGSTGGYGFSFAF